MNGGREQVFRLSDFANLVLLGEEKVGSSFNCIGDRRAVHTPDLDRFCLRVRYLISSSPPARGAAEGVDGVLVGSCEASSLLFPSAAS